MSQDTKGYVRRPPDAGESTVRALINKNEGAYPNHGTLEFWWDMAIIEAVDPKTMTLRVRTKITKKPHAPVEWTCPLFDPTTGHGVYGVPKKGMQGLLLCINRRMFFTQFNAAPDSSGVTGFSDNRESLTEGGWCVRTSNETKTIWSPNIIINQAAHLCKMVMRRITKSIEFVFFKLSFTSVGGLFNWDTDLKEKTNSITFDFKSKLGQKKDKAGKTPPDDSSTLRVLIGGKDTAGNTKPEKKAQEKENPALPFVPLLTASIVPTDPVKDSQQPVADDRMAKLLNVPGEASAVQSFRALVAQKLAQLGIKSGTDLIKGDPRNEVVLAFKSHVSASALTFPDVVGDIVGAATFVNPVTGVRELLLDKGTSVDILNEKGTFKFSEKPVVGQAFFGPNPIASTELGLSLLAEARGKSPEEAGGELLKVLNFIVSLYGGLELVHDQSFKATTEKDVTWEALKGFLKLRSMGFNFETTDKAMGTVLMSNGNAGIAWKPDGEMLFFATKFLFIPMQRVDPPQPPAPNAPQPDLLDVVKKLVDAPKEDPTYANSGTIFQLAVDGVYLGSLAPIKIQSPAGIETDAVGPIPDGNIMRKTRSTIQRDLKAAGGVLSLGEVPPPTDNVIT